MPKNIVICIDGTENQIEFGISNVLKLYRVAQQTDEQIVYYDQGIGTISLRSTWKPGAQERIRMLDSAFGHTLDRKVISAYNFLVENYAKDDRIFLFGFSRGAHAVRVLAGMIYVVGLLKSAQRNLSGSAYTAYKMASLNKSQKEARHFKRISKARTISIEFLGLWDTVSSVFRPKRSSNRFWLTRQSLLCSDNSPAVKSVRHAMAINERRRMFRVDRWAPDMEFKANYHAQGEPILQDVKEVWFPGSHSDVGGGYPREESGLSQIPFLWMVKEAETAGLLVNRRTRNHVGGIKVWDEKTRHTYPAPSHLGKLHNSMTAKWKWMEFFPKNAKFRDWKDRKAWLGKYYFPRSEPRTIARDDPVHQSAIDRRRDDTDYDPENLPEGATIEHSDWQTEFAKQAD